MNEFFIVFCCVDMFDNPNSHRSPTGQGDLDV